MKENNELTISEIHVINPDLRESLAISENATHDEQTKVIIRQRDLDTGNICRQYSFNPALDERINNEERLILLRDVMTRIIPDQETEVIIRRP